MRGELDSNVLRDLSIKVCQYFLDFLESDFKKQQAPHRRIILQNEFGFKAGMRISPYIKLQTIILELLRKPIEQEIEFEFQPKKYLKRLSQALTQVIKEHVNAVRQEQIDAVIHHITQQVVVNVKARIEAPEKWIEDIQLELHREVSLQIVRPLLTLIDEALSRQAYSQEDTIYNAENDMVLRISLPLDEVLVDVLARYSVSADTTELIEVAKERLSINVIQRTLQEYFESFASSDGFLEFRDIETYANTVEDVELYLYIGTLKFATAIYPLFYIPIEANRESQRGGYNVKISNHVYTNRKAIDFVLQEISARQGRQIVSPIRERITYISPDKSILSALEPNLIILKEAFGLFGDLDFADEQTKKLSDTNITLSNALHFCAFERSDEALLNDYEEMITAAKTNNEGVLKLFEDIVSGVITRNPISIEKEVQTTWNELTIDQRTVPDSPIPLNEEQMKVLKAIANPNGKFIVVEGPPGTGKSHTIVAIAADCAFRKKSCLILSDKPEALEVVHSKLSNTMNDIRGNDDFPNPLLKLGTEQPNFRKLTSQQTLTQVQAYVSAARSNKASIEKTRDSKRQILRKSIRDLTKTLGDLSTKHLAESQKLANELDELTDSELSFEIDSLPLLESSLAVIEYIEHDTEFPDQLFKFLEKFANYSLEQTIRILSNIKFANECWNAKTQNIFSFCPNLKQPSIQEISNILFEYQKLKKPLIGYFFQSAKIAVLNQRIQNNEAFSKQIDLSKDFTMISSFIDESRALQLQVKCSDVPVLQFEIVYENILKHDYKSKCFNDLLEFLKILQMNFSSTINNLLFNARYVSIDKKVKVWLNTLRYFYSVSYIKHFFNRAPEFDYLGSKTEVEKLNTTLMNSEVDARLVSFMQNSKTDAKILAKLIKDKQKFPEKMFGSVKEAFPIIISSIRNFGEYMPLDKDVFDVLVIDEASQVSVAQAFPALLRAKKVIVMGDSKQFSNTKSSNASISLNEQYLVDLVSYFRSVVSTEAALLQRLSFFDVKKSILEFCQLCANYSIMLRKHFRSYQELINYSSCNFYGGQLQAIKIRGVPISEVIKFTILEEIAEQKERNTNRAEANFIFERLDELLDEEKPPTVGIITPFREQQTLISKFASNHRNFNEYKLKLRLKIMTFDSCQGEERNIIFYSMVATRDSDKLNYVFPVKLDDAQEWVESKLKLQRLNVGFSRAQEAIWFVLSKPVAEYNGSIGQALRHFEIETKAVKSSRNSVDPLSPMEKKVHDWIYATSFYQNYSDCIEVLPQFPLGNYLRQLDPFSMHPAWKVDFLLTVNTDSGVLYIVIEYDGFEFHYKKGVEIDIGNHERYLNEGDIERQLTLESYGYRFIRLNRFNIGKDPVVFLSKQLERLVKKNSNKDCDDSMKKIQKDAFSILDKTSKECPKCNNIKFIDEFFDQSLKSGKGAVGRVCLSCKAASANGFRLTNKPFKRMWR